MGLLVASAGAELGGPWLEDILGPHIFVPGEFDRVSLKLKVTATALRPSKDIPVSAVVSLSISLPFALPE